MVELVDDYYCTVCRVPAEDCQDPAGHRAEGWLTWEQLRREAAIEAAEGRYDDRD